MAYDAVAFELPTEILHGAGPKTDHEDNGTNLTHDSVRAGYSGHNVAVITEAAVGVDEFGVNSGADDEMGHSVAPAYPVPPTLPALTVLDGAPSSKKRKKQDEFTIFEKLEILAELKGKAFRR